MPTTVVILLGAPGAGKGTQATRLASSLGMPHVSTGDLFRENLGNDTELGRKAKGFMERGELVPDELVLDMLFDRVSRPDCGEGYLLDGFPRTVAQAEAHAARLAEGEVAALTVVVDIQVPDSVIEGRIVGRRTCGDCGNIHHMTFSPPAVEGKCDKCGGALTQRKDDTAEVVQKRLTEYHEKTAPVVGFYQGRGDVCVVDGQRHPDEVFTDCVACVQQLGAR